MQDYHNIVSKPGYTVWQIYYQENPYQIHNTKDINLSIKIIALKCIILF